MRIKVVGFILTLLFGLTIGYVIITAAGVFLDPAVVVDAAIYAMRFVQPAVVYEMVHSLSDMLWHYRGIDMVLQGVFLFVAALAASVFFHETGQQPSENQGE
ncbi:MAG: hypothetical protein ACFFD8_03025 [Candidatus Thorarchaeota archaeon]